MHPGDRLEGRLPVKRLLLTGVAALFLATGTAHAETTVEGCAYEYGQNVVYEQCMARQRLEQARAEGVRPWQAHIHSCSIGRTDASKYVSLPYHKNTIEWDEIPDVLRALKELKPCAAFWKCVSDRDAGKVKHCYENDRRWRGRIE